MTKITQNQTAQIIEALTGNESKINELSEAESKVLEAMLKAFKNSQDCEIETPTVTFESLMNKIQTLIIPSETSNITTNTVKEVYKNLMDDLSDSKKGLQL
jgi:phosphopantetheine adenylyltransferase